MNTIMNVPHVQMVMSFAAMCVETIARQYGWSYREVYQRMKKVHLIENFIVPHYEMLHTESRENVAIVVLDCLKEWERRK